MSGFSPIKTSHFGSFGVLGRARGQAPTVRHGGGPWMSGYPTDRAQLMSGLGNWRSDVTYQHSSATSLTASAPHPRPRSAPGLVACPCPTRRRPVCRSLTGKRAPRRTRTSTRGWAGPPL
eukprot:scaffold32324_cov71-Phaeocystis_antarctica.AAC.3